MRRGGFYIDVVASGYGFYGSGLFQNIGRCFAVVIGGTGFGTFGQNAAIICPAGHDADIFFDAERQQFVERCLIEQTVTAGQ